LAVTVAISVILARRSRARDRCYPGLATPPAGGPAAIHRRVTCLAGCTRIRASTGSCAQGRSRRRWSLPLDISLPLLLWAAAASVSMTWRRSQRPAGLARRTVAGWRASTRGVTSDMVPGPASTPIWPEVTTVRSGW